MLNEDKLARFLMLIEIYKKLYISMSIKLSEKYFQIILLFKGIFENKYLF